MGDQQRSGKWRTDGAHFGLWRLAHWQEQLHYVLCAASLILLQPRLKVIFFQETWQDL